MTIQMREGWAVRRDGDVCRYVHNTAHAWGETNPWVPDGLGPKSSVRNDGHLPTDGGKQPFEGDVVELLDPWDARVPEEHREKRFVVGTCGEDGQEYPCVFDREKMVGAGFSVFYAGSEIERVTAECNADFEGGRNVPFSWLPKFMLTIDGKPCNPDGSPIAEQPKPVDEPVPAVEPESLPYKVVDQPSRTTRTLDACGWRVYGITEGNDRPRVVLEPDNRDNELSVEAARAYAAAILAVCEEIER